MLNYPKRPLIIVEECNDENGNPTCWAISGEIDPNINRPHYIWICKYSDNEYQVENSDGHNLSGGKVYKTLWGAKRDADGIIWRQDESGSYSD